MDSQNDKVRPDVMENVSESQLEELFLQFDESDRDEFNRLATTYDWSLDEADQVWNFFLAGNLQKHPQDEP